MDRAEKTIQERLAELRSILGMFQSIVTTQQAELNALQQENKNLAEEKKALIEEKRQLEEKWKSDHQPLLDGTQTMADSIEKLRDIIKIEESKLNHRKAALDEREEKLKNLEEAPAADKNVIVEKGMEDSIDKKERKRRAEAYPALFHENGVLKAEVEKLKGKITTLKKTIEEKAALIDELQKKLPPEAEAEASANAPVSTHVPIQIAGRQSSYSGYQTNVWKE